MADKIEAGPVKGDGKGEVAALEAVLIDDAKPWGEERAKMEAIAKDAGASPIRKAAAIVVAGKAVLLGGKG